MDFHSLEHWHQNNKEQALAGRYITHEHIQRVLDTYKTNFVIREIGFSVEGRNIQSIQLGSGQLKVLAWSQMHGNESTTTKAVFDLLKFFSSESAEAATILKQITLYIIPMLNPDGAERFTRVNANGVDLNRDAQQLSQPESRIFKELYEEIQPDLALNLHGQRTIFGVGNPSRSATVSLLSPAQDEERTVTPSRKRAMAIIASINTMLQEFIPAGVGRYDDSYNINCVGDTLQCLNIPTILFEAGHFPGDYHREKTRCLIFLSLIKTLENFIDSPESLDTDSERYFTIPENKKCFYDFIFRNVQLPEQGICDIAVHFEEKLVNKCLDFIPKIEKIGDLSDFYGHKEYNLNGQKPLLKPHNQWFEGAVVEQISWNSEKTITFSVN
ncbi:M14 metallopeptidase family protein [Flavimarina sp. Hel_I_48]|uniref:M14 family metallopeptidase n=1 Tax=Flavimarina sp. Hel_I_48 TaxID=1392488 RepID=UPI0004DF176D|nr:M14 metallopeptidase family protein [Flavimarina sp. Hel_I_48]